MRIRELEISLPVLLAPMAAVTDLPFRTVCEQFGLGITITEFLSARALTVGAAKTVDKLTPSLDGRIFGVQIFGREKQSMQTAARMAIDIGASVVDINMGCPAKRVVAGACGSALMKEPELAQDIVRWVIDAVDDKVPVTVKHRSGWDASHRNGPEFACAMVDAGAAMITIHGRTRAQGFSGVCDLNSIYETRRAVPPEIPVVGNGDVVCVDDYFRMREQTGCDAVMIGRGAQGNPWLFSRIKDRLDGKVDPGPPTVQTRQATFQRHLRLIREHKTGPKLLHEIRKACAWYARGLEGCNTYRKKVWVATDVDAIEKHTQDYFSWLTGKHGLSKKVEYKSRAITKAEVDIPQRSSMQ